MADVRDYIVHGPPLEYEPRYTSAGKFIFDRLRKDPEFIGQIEAHTGHEYTFAEILDRSIRLALWLREMEIKPGDVVAYVTSDHKDVIIVVYATLFVGAVLSPWDASLTIPDIVYFMGHTKPKIVICSEDTAISVKTATQELNFTPIFLVHGESSGYIPFEDTQIDSKTNVDDFLCTEVAENDAAFLMCSSGTSARPKLMQRTHKSILMIAQSWEKSTQFGAIFMRISPLCWVSGLHATLLGPSARLRRVVAPYFDPESAWKWIEMYQIISVFVIIPSFLHMIYCEAIKKYDISSLRFLMIGGSKLPARYYEKFEESVPGCKLVQVYGTTEMAGLVAITARTDASGSCGRLSPGISGKITDPNTGETISPYELGELCLRQAAMFEGYYNAPAMTESVIDSDGWFHTGDLARFDENGELFVVDRLKDVINVNGVIVSPSNLEIILERHPEIEQAGVVGKRVSPDLEHPTAFVVKKLGSNLTEEEICDFLKAWVVDDAEELQGGVKFVDTLPRSVSGKLKRCELRKMLESEN